MQGPHIVSRSDWGARPPGGQLVRMQRYDGFVIHHSEGPQPTTPGDGAARVRAIQRFHQDSRGWVDIGYNFLIDGGGLIYQGRPQVGTDQARGAHSPPVNSTRIGICLLGCFHPPLAGCDDVPATAQQDSLVALCRHLIVRYWMQAPALGGHRDHRATNCPGDTLYGLLPTIRQRIGGPYGLSLPTPTA